MCAWWAWEANHILPPACYQLSHIIFPIKIKAWMCQTARKETVIIFLRLKISFDCLTCMKWISRSSQAQNNGCLWWELMENSTTNNNQIRWWESAQNCEPRQSEKKKNNGKKREKKKRLLLAQMAWITAIITKGDHSDLPEEPCACCSWTILIPRNVGSSQPLPTSWTFCCTASSLQHLKRLRLSEPWDRLRFWRASAHVLK